MEGNNSLKGLFKNPKSCEQSEFVVDGQHMLLNGTCSSDRILKEEFLIKREEKDGSKIIENIVMGDDMKGKESFLIEVGEKNRMAASAMVPSGMAVENNKDMRNSDEDIGGKNGNSTQLHKTIILGDEEDDSSKEEEEIHTPSSSHSESFRLSTGEDLNSYPSRFSFENVLIKGILHPKMVSVTLLVQYLVILSYAYNYQDLVSTVALGLSFVIGFLVNTHFALSSIWQAVKVGADKAGNAEDDKGRMICNLLLFSIRFYYLRSMRMMLLPIYFMIITSNNNLKREDMVWTLIPTYYISFHFIGNILVRFFFLLIGSSSEDFGYFFAENISTMMCVVMFSFYITTISMHLKNKVTSLEHTSSKLQAALLAKQTFLRHISHEFRSPCLSSLGSVELLRETNLSEQQTELVDTIASADGILLTLIEDILLLATLEHEKTVDKKGAIDKYIQVFNLGKCMKLLENIIRSYCTQFNVTCKLIIDEEAKNAYVRANQARIQQVISNLLTNAVKASHKDGLVELICNCEGEPKFVNGIKEQNFVFKVVDHGVGIERSKQQKIFEPFFQLHNVNEATMPSSGLGLNTVMHNVRSMKGTISVESDLGIGSTFIVSLPLELVEDTLARNGSKDDLTNSSINRQLQIQASYLKLFEHSEKDYKLVSNPKAKIILAEDNSINRKVLVKLLENLGFQCDTVRDGKELIDKVDFSKHKLVITDLNMPHLNGLQAATILRERYRDQLKIIVLTADVLCDFPTNVFDAVIMKPCNKATLQPYLDKWAKD